MYVFVSRHCQSQFTIAAKWRRWLASGQSVVHSSLSVTASRVGLICHKDQLKRKKTTSRLPGVWLDYIEVNGKSDYGGEAEGKSDSL